MCYITFDSLSSSYFLHLYDFHQRPVSFSVILWYYWCQVKMEQYIKRPACVHFSCSYSKKCEKCHTFGVISGDLLHFFDIYFIFNWKSQCKGNCPKLKTLKDSKDVLHMRVQVLSFCFVCLTHSNCGGFVTYKRHWILHVYPWKWCANPQT